MWALLTLLPSITRNWRILGLILYSISCKYLEKPFTIHTFFSFATLRLLSPFRCTHICIRTLLFRRKLSRFLSTTTFHDTSLASPSRCIHPPTPRPESLYILFAKQYLQNFPKKWFTTPLPPPYTDTAALPPPLRFSTLSSLVDCTFVHGFSLSENV